MDWFRLQGYCSQQQLIAAAGLEYCGSELLLRSVVTDPDHRSQGIAARLIESLHQSADKADARVWLLTMDASRYFSDVHGYQVVDRKNASEAIRNSTQFSNLCPDSAILMRR